MGKRVMYLVDGYAGEEKERKTESEVDGHHQV